MSFEEYLSELKPLLDDAFERELFRFVGNGSEEESSSILFTLEGGKRIRGALLCRVCSALGGSLEFAIPRATAIELIHAASLIHDDFVDQDTVRRNRPATWTLEGARRAVLLGDVIFASAIEMMSALSRDDGLVASRAIARVAKGAFQEETDPLMLAQKIQQGSFDGSVYERIIALKTGVLFAAACRLGGLAAGAGKEIQECLCRYGTRIGEIYQMADDLQDVKQHHATGTISANDLAVLAPAFFYFLPGMPPQFISMLESEHSRIDDSLASHLKRVERRLEEEIARRLDTMASELLSIFPGNNSDDWLHHLPRDLIRMFDHSC